MSTGISELLRDIKDVRIKYYSSRDKTGDWYSYTAQMPGLWGVGSTIDASIEDMIRTLKQGCEDYCAMMMQGGKVEESRQALIMKVVCSPVEELLRCLDGEICEDF